MVSARGKKYLIISLELFRGANRHLGDVVSFDGQMFRRRSKEKDLHLERGEKQITHLNTCAHVDTGASSSPIECQETKAMRKGHFCERSVKGVFPEG